MRPTTLPILVLLLATLPGCARLQASALNPLNWFGIAPPAERVVADTAVAVPGTLLPNGPVAAPTDLRVPVAQVTGLQLDPSPDGVIVTASGLAAAPGAFNAGLVETGRAEGVLRLELRAELPDAPVAGSRGVTAGLALSNAALAGIGTVIVGGAGNSLSARR